jgi:hypothetical protein
VSTTTAHTFVSKHCWHRASVDNISAYRDSVHTLLSEIPIRVYAILSREVSCFDVKHKAPLTRYARFLSEACLIAADTHIPTAKSSFPSPVPDWNEYTAPFREKSLFWHHLWLENGKPRTGILTDIMRQSTASYHRDIRHVNKYRVDIVNERFAEALTSYDSRDFWREGVSITVKTQHNAAVLLARNKLNSKAIYSALQKANFQEPRINRIHPGINFESMWRALSYRDLNPQARDLAFKITHKILPTKDFLGKYKIIKNPICCLCKTQTESIQHTFKFCSRIKPILSFYNAATDNSEQDTDPSLFQLTNEKDDLQKFKLIVKTELALEVWKQEIG